MANRPRQWTDCILPADYHAFLKTHDGAPPIRRCLLFGSPNTYSDLLVRRFFLPDDLTENFERYVVTRRVPDGHLPIASDSGGNMICLGVGRKNRGRVFFWHHEDEGYPEALTQIAATFTEFLERLKEPDPTDDLTGQVFVKRPPDPEVVQLALFDEG